MIEFVETYPRSRFRLTSSFRLNRYVADIIGQALGDRAADTLRQRAPELSSGTYHRPSRLAYGSIAALIVGGLFVLHGPTIAVIETILTVCFLSWLGLRLLGCFLPPATISGSLLADRDLPVYTIIVALYREASTVQSLIASLRAIAYPGIR